MVNNAVCEMKMNKGKDGDIVKNIYRDGERTD